MTDTTALTCPSCQASLGEDDRFCEQCGARLAEPEEETSDRIELDLIVAAAISDRGRVHRRNEDAFHLEIAGEHAVSAVVCDGISTASAGDVAARDAAKAAGTVLASAAADRSIEGTAAVIESFHAAHDSVQKVRWTTRTDRGMPSCTLVAALRRQQEIIVGSVGDSRAYWITRHGLRQLTVDDSWATEQVADGVLTFEQALGDPRAHSITNWVGPDAPERHPRLTRLVPDQPGRLLLCTDGLWNYMASEDELAEQIEALPEGASAAAVARALTETALLRGGRDNITVAVIDVVLQGEEDP